MNMIRESIIASAVRSFCTSFAAILGVLIALFLGVTTIMMFSTPDVLPPKSRMTISPDANFEQALLPLSTPAILKLNISGVIGQGALTTDKIKNLLLNSHSDLLAGNRVKAIFLYMDTPGGTVTDSNGIYRAILAYKKKYQVPVYAFVDGMCASGGMYIASAADKVFATSSSVIGSVGVVIGPTFNVSKLMEQYGVQALTITQGKDKDMLNPFRPWKPNEDESLQVITKDLYEQFVDIVVAARPQMNRDKLINEYGANIFVAAEAQEFGYIDDSDSTYSDAMHELALAAQIPEGHSYQVVTMETEHPFFSDLTLMKSNLLSGKFTHVFQIGPYMNSELSGRLLYLYQPAIEMR